MRNSCLVGTFALLVACKHQPPPPAEAVAPEQLCTDPKYDSHDDPATAKEAMHRVAVEGTLDISRATVVLCSQWSCDIDLRYGAGSAARSLGLHVKLGDDANEMKALPDGFSEKDLVVHAGDGRTLGVGAKVRVTGYRIGTSKGACGLTDVDGIEAL